jgi:hypothetical protein
MKERPIIFSTDSIRAILEGRKTQTRRVIKPLPECFDVTLQDMLRYFKCHFGVPGDRLWVRETFYNHCPPQKSTILYYARTDHQHYPVKWKSPMFMPRWASRITLEITDVRCERIQSISAEDCLAEGYESIGAYIDEWDRLNAKRGFSWDANPYVWVLEFKQVKGE